MDLKFLYTGDIHWNVPAFSKISSIIKEEKDPYILLDAGDSISSVSDGLESILAMNLIGYNFLTIGNHALDIKPEKLSLVLNKSEFTIFSPNISIPGFSGEEFKLMEIDNIKIGVLGVCFPGIVKSQHLFEGYEISDSEPILEKIPIYRKQCDVLILLSHLGYDKDIEVAKKYPELDLIIGGHTHTILKEGKIVNNTLICHSGGEGNFLGKIIVSLDNSKKIISKSHKLFSLSDEKEDEDFLKKFNAIKEEQGIYSGDKIIGEALCNFVAEKYSGETAIGDFVTDLIRLNTETDIVILNATCVNPILTLGKITYELLQQVIYWDNELNETTITGALLYRIISRMLSLFVEDPYYFLYFSGIQVEYIDNPVCRRVFKLLENISSKNTQSMYIKTPNRDKVNMCNLCKEANSPVCLRDDPYTSCVNRRINIYKDGVLISPNSFYSLIVPSFLIRGGLNQQYSPFFEECVFTSVDINIKELLIDYFKIYGSLKYVQDNRLKIYFERDIKDSKK